MVAVHYPLSSSSIDADLGAALDAGRSDDAMLGAARALHAGVSPNDLLGQMLEKSMALCGLEAAGASWSHALLSVGAVSGLLTRWGPRTCQPSVVGVAGFLAHARPTRDRVVPDGPSSWPGTRSWLDLIRIGDLNGSIRAWRAGPDVDAWRAACLLSSAGWGHQAIIGGHFARMGCDFPHLSSRLHEAAIRAWIPMELEPEEEPAIGAPAKGVEQIAEAISESPARAAAQAEAGPEAITGAVVAALALLAKTPDLRAVHGVTYAREVFQWSQTGVVTPTQRRRLLSFVGGGWDRARRDRRLRGSEMHFQPGSLPAPGDPCAWEATIAELCRTELRPGFGHNVKIAETCSWLSAALPPRFAGWVFPALEATVVAWTRSRRPALVWRRVSQMEGGV